MYVHGLLFKQHTDKNMFSLLKLYRELFFFFKQKNNRFAGEQAVAWFR